MNLFNRRAFSLVFLMVVLLSREAKCQSLLQKEITTKFQGYVRDFPRKEVFIHTDRNEYISGEQLWFNAYVIDRQSNGPSDNTSILYVELLNSSNCPVAQKRVHVVNGYGPGEIYLPDTISTGSFVLRAYTSYMKNFLPDNCFMKQIKIYNAITIKDNSTGIKQPDNRVDGQEKITSEQVHGLSGFNARIIRHDKDTLEFLINTDEKFRSANGASLLIFIQTRGIINHVATISLTANNIRSIVPGKVLTPGINHVTFFNSTGQPVNEKYLYTPDEEIMPVASLNRESFARREKVTIEFDLSSNSESSSSTPNMSLSVIPCTGGAYMHDLKKYLVFGSEFGYVPDEIIYSSHDKTEASGIDKFLSDAHSNWINWEDILKEDKRDLKYKEEKDEHYLSGRLIQKESGLPVGGQCLFLSIPGKSAVFQCARTDNEGGFSFVIPVTEALNDIIIQPEMADKNYSIEIAGTFADAGQPGGIIEKGTEYNVPAYINRWGVNYQVGRIYGISVSKSVENLSFKLPEPRRFYGKPDIEIIMDDYIKLPVMSEVFFELLPGVSLKTRKSKTEITLFGSNEYMKFRKPPAMLIDGVIINDAAIIDNLDPEIVEKIDVVKESYIVGDYLFYGLVNVITRDGDFSHVTLPDYAVRLKYRVFNPVLSFISPDYSVIQTSLDKIPDFRNTLYWNPSVKPSENGKVCVNFWTSDLLGDYEINIQGFSSDGKPVSIRRIITVH